MSETVIVVGVVGVGLSLVVELLTLEEDGTEAMIGSVDTECLLKIQQRVKFPDRLSTRNLKFL